MKYGVFFACTAILLTGTHVANAEDRSARFLQMMAMLPAATYANRSDIVPEFVDLDAGQRVLDALAITHPGALEQNAARHLSGPFSDRELASSWVGTSGFAFTDIRAAALLNDSDEPGMALLLEHDVVARVQPAFLANGYAIFYDLGFPALWRGREDEGFNMAWRNKDDPFAYSVPYTSRVALKGDVLIQTKHMPQLERLYRADQTPAALTAFARALDLPDWGDRDLVEAMIFSDPVMFSNGFVVGENMQPILLPEGATPYWSNMMIADLSGGTNDLTLIALLYHSKADATVAAESLGPALAAAQLPSFGDRTLGELFGPSTSMVVGEGPSVAIIAFESEPDLSYTFRAVNTVYRGLLNAANRRELYPLGVLMP